MKGKKDFHGNIKHTMPSFMQETNVKAKGPQILVLFETST